MAVIPDKVQNAKVYLEGNAILGVADAELPKVEFLSEKMSQQIHAHPVDALRL